MTDKLIEDPFEIIKPDGSLKDSDEQLIDMRLLRMDFLNHLTRDEYKSYQNRLNELHAKIEELNIEFNDIVSHRIG